MYTPGPDDTQLVVDIGHLRDLDHSPENIK